MGNDTFLGANEMEIPMDVLKDAVHGIFRFSGIRHCLEMSVNWENADYRHMYAQIAHFA